MNLFSTVSPRLENEQQSHACNQAQKTEKLGKREAQIGRWSENEKSPERMITPVKFGEIAN